MAADVPTVEPTIHQAGTTLLFTRTYPNYPPPTWTLSYALRSDIAAPIDITAVQDGTGFSVTEAFGVTETWTPGDYYMTGYATSATERHVVYEGWITITPYFAGEVTSDKRTYAEKMVELIESQLTSGIVRNSVSYSINGRSFTCKSNQDLLYAYNYFKAQVATESTSWRPKILCRFVPAQ